MLVHTVFRPLLSRLGGAGFALGAMLTLAAADFAPLVEAPELKANLGSTNLVVVDIRSGETKEKGGALFQAGHVPGAVHADYAHAAWRLPREKVSVYLPEPAQFEALAGDLGISNDSRVVIVHEGTDATSFGAAARVYWTFKAMGHASVSILNGGYRAWTQDAANPIAKGASQPQAAIFEARPVPELRASLDDVLTTNAARTTLVDSRPTSYFTGLEKHRGVQAFGHIPGAVSVPHSLSIGTDFRVKPKTEVEKAFANVPDEQASIAYCNTGHWAATDWFMLSEVLGRKNVKLYDGSMLEYSLEKRGPVANPRANSGS